MSSFDAAFEYVVRNEKGLVNNPNDTGKITNFGISLRFLKNVLPENLRSYGIFDEVSDLTIVNLTLEQAKKIYQGEFWDHAPFERIGNQDHANYVFDMAISMGIAPAIKCLQRACWAVIKRQEVVDDGILGEKTLNCLHRCGILIMPAMRSERAGYYRLTVDHNQDDKVFIQGWMNRAYEFK